MRGDGEHLRRVEFDHLTVLVLSDNGEEIEQSADTRLAVLVATRIACGDGNQVVCVLVVDFEGAGGIEVEDIRGLLAEELRFLLSGLRVGDGTLLLALGLRAKGGLDVGGRTLHIGEHEDAVPFGNRDADGELPDGQGDGLVVMGDCVDDLLEIARDSALVDVLLMVVCASVADGSNDFVAAEERVAAKHVHEGVGGIDTV